MDTESLIEIGPVREKLLQARQVQDFSVISRPSQEQAAISGFFRIP